jgi:hypothetical protein
MKFTNEDPMPLSGEAIRLMNYIDDVAVTLRRILAAAPTLTPEEALALASTSRRPVPARTMWPRRWEPTGRRLMWQLSVGRGTYSPPQALTAAVPIMTVTIIGAGPLGRWLAQERPLAQGFTSFLRT